jgi:hypothetical protein
MSVGSGLHFSLLFGAKTFEATVQTSELAGFIAEKIYKD